MGYLNQEKCYTLDIGLHTAVDEATAVSGDWQQRLCTICSSQGDSADDEAVSRYAHDLQKHIGIESTYIFKEALITGLQCIFKRLSVEGEQALAISEKTAIIYKLKEDIKACTPGFHNRVNEVLSGFYIPNSIDALLTQIRLSLIDSVARHNSDDVHTHNRFTVIASETGFGVPVLNKDDIYIGNMKNDEIHEQIKKKFASEYQIIHVLMMLVDNIKSALLTHYNYTGIKTDDIGYTYRQYTNIIDYLQTLFGNYFLNDHVTEVNHYFIIDEETSKISDMNWSAIKQTLIYTLSKKNYIIIDNDELECITYLLRDRWEEDKKDTDVNFLINKLFIHDTLTLCSFFSFINDANPTLQLQIISGYIKTLPLDAQFLELGKIMSRITPSSSLTNQIKQFVDEHVFVSSFLEKNAEDELPIFVALKNHLDLRPFLACLALLDNRKKSTILIHVDKENYSLLTLAINIEFDLVRPITKIISYLPIDLQMQIFTQTDESNVNPIMFAAAFSTDALMTILNEVRKLPPALQLDVLKRKNLHKQNPIMIAITYKHENIKLLFELIHGLPENQKEELLKEVDSKHQNLLMIAADDSLAATKLILKEISKLPFDLQLDLFIQKNENQRTVISYLQKKPDIQLIFINTFLKLPHSYVISLLNHINTSERIPFFSACFLQPRMANILINEIHRTDFTERNYLLTCCDKKKQNVLMYSIINCPSVVYEIVTCIKQLLPAQQLSIFSQVSKNKDNALMRACEFSPLCLSEILEVFSEFKTSSQLTILLQKNRFKQNALELLSEKNPEYIGILLNHLFTFHPDHQQFVLGGHYKNVLHYAIERHPKALEGLLITLEKNELIQQDLCLNNNLEKYTKWLTLTPEQNNHIIAIKLTIDLYSLKLQIEDVPTTTLNGLDQAYHSKKLLNELTSGLKLFKQNGDIRTLQSAWNKAIECARPFLSKYQKGMFCKAGLIIGFIPSLANYVYEHHYLQKKSYGFFSPLKSNLEKKIDELQEVIDPISRLCS